MKSLVIAAALIAAFMLPAKAEPRSDDRAGRAFGLALMKTYFIKCHTDPLTPKGWSAWIVVWNDTLTQAEKEQADRETILVSQTIPNFCQAAEAGGVAKLAALLNDFGNQLP